MLALPLRGAFCLPFVLFVTVPAPWLGVCPATTSLDLRTVPPVGDSIFPELLGLTCVCLPLVEVLVLTVSLGLFILPVFRPTPFPPDEPPPGTTPPRFQFLFPLL